MEPVAVTLYTRPDCSLCDKAEAAIRASGIEIDLRKVDIDQEPALRALYSNDVPVVFVGGREAFRHFVEPDAFAEYVRGENAPSAAASTLAAERCVPCRGGIPPLRGAELEPLKAELGGGWQVVNEHHLEKSFEFPDFRTALEFTNRIGAIAEEEGHHPDIHLAWGRVGVTIWTHKIDGLTRSDFVLAAKIDGIAGT